MQRERCVSGIPGRSHQDPNPSSVNVSHPVSCWALLISLFLYPGPRVSLRQFLTAPTSRPVSARLTSATLTRPQMRRSPHSCPPPGRLHPDPGQQLRSPLGGLANSSPPAPANRVQTQSKNPYLLVPPPPKPWANLHTRHFTRTSQGSSATVVAASSTRTRSVTSSAELTRTRSRRVLRMKRASCIRGRNQPQRRPP